MHQAAAFQCAGGSDAPGRFCGGHKAVRDDRRHHSEKRYSFIGRIEGRMIVLVWTPRRGVPRIIRLRKTTLNEQRAYRHELD